MTTTTFGYSATQDRIWMRAHEVDVTVWLTRRMVLSVLGPMLTAFEVSTPGEQGGAAPKARAAIEHHLALHEAAPGQSPPQIRAGREVHAPVNDAMDGLCLRISSRVNGQGVVLQFETSAAPLVLSLSRKGMHLWYRGLAMVIRQAQWNLPGGLPPWLQTDMTPPAVQAILDQPLPPDLDDPLPGR